MYTYNSASAHTFSSMHACVYVSMCVCVQTMYVCMYVYVCICMYSYAWLPSYFDELFKYGRMHKKVLSHLVCSSHGACLVCMLPEVQVTAGLPWGFLLCSSHLCDSEDCDSVP